MGESEAKGFTSRELLRELINETREQSNRLTAIEVHLENGSKTMASHANDIKELNKIKDRQAGAIKIVGGIGLLALLNALKNLFT